MNGNGDEGDRTGGSPPLDDEDEAWLAERLAEYAELLEYLRSH